MSSPALVLLPGLDGGSALRQDFLDALGPRLPATLLPYPLTPPLDHAGLADLLAPALPRDRPFLLLGESFGGPLALLLAARRPPGLLGVVLCASFARYPAPLRAGARMLGLLPLRLAPLALLEPFVLGRWRTPALRAALAASLDALPAATLRARLRSVLQVDARAQVRALEVPLLVLQARHDRVVPVTATRELQRLAPTSRQLDIAGPHFLLQAAPRDCAQAVIEWTARISPGVRQ